jgi:hypothetical protein
MTWLRITMYPQSWGVCGEDERKVVISGSKAAWGWGIGNNRWALTSVTEMMRVLVNVWSLCTWSSTGIFVYQLIDVCLETEKELRRIWYQYITTHAKHNNTTTLAIRGRKESYYQNTTGPRRRSVRVRGSEEGEGDCSSTLGIPRVADIST